MEYLRKYNASSVQPNLAFPPNLAIFFQEIEERVRTYALSFFFLPPHPTQIPFDFNFFLSSEDLISFGISVERGKKIMLKSIENISFTDWKPILISLVVPLSLILFLSLHRRFNRGKTKEIKEDSASENDNEIRTNNKNKKKNRFQSCYDFSSILGWETDTTTTNSGPQAGPISLTVADKLGFIAHEANPAQDKSEPGPNSQITIGHLLGRTGDRKHRKWVVSMKRAAARFACGNPTVGDDRSGEGKPLISLMKEMDRAEQSRKPKRVLGVKRDKAQNGNEKKVCHVCSQRSNNATLVPCGHVFCRVCSREIWINTKLSHL